MTQTLTLPGTSLLDLPSDTVEKIRQCPRVLLFGRSNNYHKIAFVSPSYEILPVLLKEAPELDPDFSLDLLDLTGDFFRQI